MYVLLPPDTDCFFPQYFHDFRYKAARAQAICKLYCPMSWPIKNNALLNNFALYDVMIEVLSNKTC